MKLRCEKCRDTFQWDSKNDWPRHCPLCGEYIGVDDKDEVVMPFISKAANKAADNVYRQMEAGAEHRINMATELIPGSKREDFNEMKITNLQTGLRQGDIAAAPVVNEVTKRMDEMRSKGMPVGFGVDGTTYSSEVQGGKFPNAGAHMQKALRAEHARRIDPRHAGVALSELPALETQQDTYRKRV